MNYRLQNTFFYWNYWLSLLGGRCKHLLTIGGHCPCLMVRRTSAVPFNLTKPFFASPSITSLQFKGIPRGEYCPTNLTPWKKHVGDSIGHIAEIMCSSADVNAVEKELKYSSGNYEENWRYFRHLFAIYPSAMQNGIIMNEVSLKAGTTTSSPSSKSQRSWYTNVK